MKSPLFLVFALMISAVFTAQAQVKSNIQNPTSINEDGADPDDSAILDIQSLTQGMLVPRMNESQRLAIANPANGLLVFDTSSGSFWFFANGNWQNLSSSGGGSGSSIADADQDTKIQVEESMDEDIIRFDIMGEEEMVLSTSPNGRTTLGFPTNDGNVFIGTESGIENTSGDFNTFFGRASGRFNSLGSSNTFLGNASGLNNIDGSNNTFIGDATGLGNTTGSFNTFIGRSVGLSNTTGATNTYVGSEAGFSATGSGNVFLGYRAGDTETGDNKLYIENSSSMSPLIYGEFDNDLLRVNGSLNVNNAFTFPTTDGTANQILQTDGAGNVSWVNNAGGNSTFLEDADMDTKIQVEESADEDIIRMDIAGLEVARFEPNRIQLDLGGKNTFLGFNAGINNTIASPDGVQNTFIGSSSGVNNTTGSSNTFLGEGSGFGNEIGSDNVFIGYIAGAGSTSGNQNTFIGRGAGSGINNGSGNVCIGFEAARFGNGSNKLYIENSSNIKPLIYGEFDNNIARINGRLEATEGFNDADGDTKIQVEESADEDIIRFDVEGVEVTTFFKNRLNLNQSGDNTFIGFNAGRDNTISPTTGRRNTFIGSNAGRENTNGLNNTGVGHQSGVSNKTGEDNTFIGTQAGLFNVAGDQNTYLGSRSGYLGTGDGNIMIGFEAGFNETGSNKLFIENSSTATPPSSTVSLITT